MRWQEVGCTVDTGIQAREGRQEKRGARSFTHGRQGRQVRVTLKPRAQHCAAELRGLRPAPLFCVQWREPKSDAG